MSMPFGVVAIAPSQDKNEDAEFPIEVVGKRYGGHINQGVKH